MFFWSDPGERLTTITQVWKAVHGVHDVLTEGVLKCGLSLCGVVGCFQKLEFSSLGLTGAAEAWIFFVCKPAPITDSNSLLERLSLHARSATLHD
jgi:hypothetical protein